MQLDKIVFNKGCESANLAGSVLKNLKDITLKNFVVDEVGYTFNNDISLTF